MNKKILSLLMLGSMVASTGIQAGWFSDIFKDDRSFAEKAFKKVKKLTKKEWRIAKSELPGYVRGALIRTAATVIAEQIINYCIATPYYAIKNFLTGKNKGQGIHLSQEEAAKLQAYIKYLEENQKKEDAKQSETSK
ncbi:hypothetical protein ACFLYU_05540 [Candidatus Dependentiae bacterium]